jgi:hypothetical protein
MSNIIYRDLKIDRANIDTQKRIVALSFSSEDPYKRYFGFEILDHSPGSVKLHRLNDGAALLWNHYSSEQIGVIEQAFIGDDKKGRALVRFGKSKNAEEKFQDVVDEIIRNVSVGYKVDKMILDRVEPDPDDSDSTIKTYRVTDWTPLEISLAPVPADATVGIGRNIESDYYEKFLIKGENEQCQKKKRKINLVLKA